MDVVWKARDMLQSIVFSIPCTLDPSVDFVDDLRLAVGSFF